MIRLAEIDDADAMARIRMAAIGGLTGSHYSDEERRAWQASGGVGLLHVPIAAGRVLVEDAGNGVCGFAQLDAQHGAIERLYVSPKHARQGIGKRLLAAMEALARDLGSARLAVESSLNAVGFYQSAGYTMATPDDTKLSPGVVLMTKDIRS